MACTLFRFLRRAALVCAALAALPCTAAVTVGVLAPEGAEEALRDWQRVAAHLARALPDAQWRWQYLDLPALSAAVRARQVDFVVTNSGHYVELEAAFGAHRIATLERPEALSPTEALASAVVVRADRTDLRTLENLRGRRVTAVAENAFGGYQIAWHELWLRGIDPRRDFAALDFAGFPLQDIVLAVRAGRTDAGIVRTCLLEAMARRGQVRLDEFRVLGAVPGDRYPCLRSTRLYPDWPFAALAHTPHALSKRVATALLTLPAAPGEAAWTVPTDYQPVHELFRTLQIGPYAHLGDLSFAALVARYRWWLALAALLARQAAEGEARRQQEQLDHLARLGVLGELSSMLAHELNQPLSAIGNFARGMERRIEAGRLDGAALLQGSREIAEQAERARDIMQRIRGFARKRQGERRPLRLARAVDGAVALFRGIGAQAPSVRVHVDPQAWALADRLQIEEVLLNLLKNALDAMHDLPPGERQIEVGGARQGDAWRLWVQDNGIGLDEATRVRLFEPFFTTKPEGLGLGLAICKTIVEAHGGRLWAEPNPAGRGLRLCFTLPALDEESKHV